jgi:hypothetical protein
MINWGRVAATLALVALLAAGLWKLHHTGVESGRAEVQAQWNLAKLAQADADKLAEADTRQRERALQDDADNLRKAKDEQITKISGQLKLALAAVRVQHATPRPPDYTPAPAGTGAACSGSSLYREDAEFLIRESSRADELRAAYLYCEAQYAKARDAVNAE